MPLCSTRDSTVFFISLFEIADDSGVIIFSLSGLVVENREDFICFPFCRSWSSSVDLICISVSSLG